MKQQVVVIHGGDSFPTRRAYLRSLTNWPVSKRSFLPRADWKANLQADLGRNFEVLQPRMPNKTNAQYPEWEIWFKRLIPFLHQRVILVGHSLGGMFLAKYLATHTFPKKIRQLILVAAPHNQTGEIGNFRLPGNLHRVQQQAGAIAIYHSTDDPIVPFSESEEFLQAWPKAKRVILRGKGHVYQAHFPRLVRSLKATR